MRNQLYPHWNRSSAHTPEVLGALNGAIRYGVQHAILIFDKEIELAGIPSDLLAEVRAEVIPIIAQGVTDGVMQFAESLTR